MPLRPENIAPLIRKMKWRVILADLLCVAGLALAIFAINRPDLYAPAVVVLMVAIVMALLSIGDK